MATRTLTVNLVGRTDKLIRSFKNASKGADTMSGKLMRATRMASIGFGVLGGAAVGAAMAIKPMIDKAASLEESLSKNRLMFGEASKAVERFAETAGHAFGVSERAALEATGIFGSLGNAMGMSEEASASMATTLTGLAGDLSSLHDVDVETALTALRAGLIGEAEPLRKLGILLDAATIKSKALAMGLVKTTKDALTPAIKSQAAYALILEKGEIAMGDFVRTSDSATNQSKLLAVEWDKIQTEIGTALLPAFTSIVTHLNEEVLPAVRQFWSDPSWAEGGKLTAKVIGSEFFTSLTSVLKGPTVTPAELDDLPWWESWKASSELAWAAAAISNVATYVSNIQDEMARDPAQEALAAAYETAAEAMAGRPPGGLGQRPTPAPAFTGGGDINAIAEELLAAAAPMPGGPFLGALMDSIEAGLALEGAASPSESTVDFFRGDPADFAPPTTPAAGPMVPGPMALAPVDPDLDRFLKVVGTTDWDNFLAAQAAGGPPNTQIVINAPAVSGQEVVEAIGKYVDGNGPLPPHWQQGAN